MTNGDPHKRLLSTEYLDAMRSAWRQVDLLRRSGDFSVEWIVQRARAMYRQAWRDEVRRSRSS